MLSIEKLNEYGADTKTGLQRCMDNVDFYLQMVKMMNDEKNFTILNDAIAENDLKKAFEAAHAIKGVAGNLALTPIYEPSAEMTELLRANTQMDYSEYLEKINYQKRLLEDIINEE